MPRISFTCEVCGAHVTAWRSPSTLTRTGRFCSQPCVTTARQQGMIAGRKHYTPRVEFTCEGCGKAVSRAPSLAAKGARYCSRECAARAKERGATFTCVGCGKTVKAPPSQVGKKRYCSMECLKAHKKPRITCEACGKVRAVSPINLKQNARFCSWECANELLNQPQRVTVVCEQCERTFSVHRYRVVEGVRFCSYSCRSIYNISNGMITSPTSIETMLYEALDELGIEYIPQHPMPEARTVPDAFVPSLNLVLYADGNYWHALPGAAARDARQNRRLAELGYTVRRLSETEIRRDALGVVGQAIQS